MTAATLAAHDIPSLQARVNPIGVNTPQPVIAGLTRNLTIVICIFTFLLLTMARFRVKPGMTERAAVIVMNLACKLQHEDCGSSPQ